jgi:hypothetical protein
LTAIDPEHYLPQRLKELPMSAIRPTVAFAMLLGLAVALPAVTRGAEAEGDPKKRATSFQAVIDCRNEKDDSARLACYDAKVGALVAAEASRDVVIVDKAQINEGRRQLFGLALPNFTFFKDTPKSEQVTEISGVVKTVGATPTGRWIITLQDGAIWQQMEDKPLARQPKAGSTVVIKNASLGSYMVRIDGQTGIRARRIE